MFVKSALKVIECISQDISMSSEVGKVINKDPIELTTEHDTETRLLTGKMY